MNDTSSKASLTTDEGQKIEINATCVIGRSPRNDLQLPDEEVSRNHAMIHQQAENEYWLVDLGSSNGSRLNGHIVTKPCSLKDGDQLRIGQQDLLFKCAQKSQTQSVEKIETLTGATMRKLRVTKQWLILADIQGFTRLSQSLEPQELAQMIGCWTSSCRQIMQKHGGNIHKYLGDGWFGSWEDENQTRQVASCLTDLLEHQKNASPPFRITVHFGKVTSSGSPASDDLGMLGSDVNLLFRLESLAGQLSCDSLISEDAWSRLAGEGDLLKADPFGSHLVKGFTQHINCLHFERSIS